MRIIVNSLPKSGTHLLGRLTDLLGFSEYTPGLTGALLREIERNPFSRWSKRRRKAPELSDFGLPIDLDIPGNWVRKDWLHNFLNQIPNGYYITAHLPYNVDLSNFLVANGFRIIFISRDPRDVLISYINFQKKREDYPFHEYFNSVDKRQQIQGVINGLVKGNTVLSPFSCRLERAIGWLKDENTLALRFEDVIGDSGHGDDAKQDAAVRRVTDWCGIETSEEKIKEISSHIFDRQAETFHKGTIGQWRHFFDDKSLDDLMDCCGDLIKEYGYM